MLTMEWVSQNQLFFVSFWRILQVFKSASQRQTPGSAVVQGLAEWGRNSQGNCFDASLTVAETDFSPKIAAGSFASKYLQSQEQRHEIWAGGANEGSPPQRGPLAASRQSAFHHMQLQKPSTHSMQLRPRRTTTETQWTTSGQVLGGKKAKESRLLSNDKADMMACRQSPIQRLQYFVDQHPFIFAALMAALAVVIVLLVQATLSGAGVDKQRSWSEADAHEEASDNDVRRIVQTVFCPSHKGEAGVQACEVTYTQNDDGICPTSIQPRGHKELSCCT
ncbi:uncharacterized protein MYCFIDRAFT_179744 [Pseudocercospora fijiensis CIRAD86]|uniref:Uncharacterized protein n=1 Tax=Pseudocercospora fijiensis (strain CIRAD86) TaxID=383855 RepID=M2ZZB1_PSEFD|nr:uncharacterized protein MYCFIDRAFT_179744 [Pseudocercospora fijiensis CIRAD86]EME77501.1 hypothetical protein MYCFIDRAFT_179744 [Pseudocercospora fijiensis CIRAD86]